MGLFLDDGLFLDASAEVVIVPPTFQIDLDTLGTADVERVRVAFTGPSVSAPGFVATTAKGEVIGWTFGAALAAGQTLVVDNWARTVLLDGVPRRDLFTALIGNRHGEFARLGRGLNSIFISGQPADARIRFTPTYN